MTERTISEDATIADIVSKLDNPRDYVREVWQNMMRVSARHGSVVVRIGITGIGRRPNYQIDAADRTDALLHKLMLDETDAKLAKRLDAKIDAYHVFSGENHIEQTTWDRASINWSTRHMALDDVKALLDRLGG